MDVRGCRASNLMGSNLCNGSGRSTTVSIGGGVLCIAVCFSNIAWLVLHSDLVCTCHSLLFVHSIGRYVSSSRRKQTSHSIGCIRLISIWRLGCITHRSDNNALVHAFRSAPAREQRSVSRLPTRRESSARAAVTSVHTVWQMCERVNCLTR